MNLLQITAEDYGSKIIETKGFLESLGFGGRMLLLGMGTVFAVLLILWFSLFLFRIFFYDIPTKKKAEAEEIKEYVTKSEESARDASDTELIAVLAAAIAAAEAESGGVKYRVVSFKRK